MSTWDLAGIHSLQLQRNWRRKDTKVFMRANCRKNSNTIDQIVDLSRTMDDADEFGLVHRFWPLTSQFLEIETTTVILDRFYVD